MFCLILSLLVRSLLSSSPFLIVSSLVLCSFFCHLVSVLAFSSLLFSLLVLSRLISALLVLNCLLLLLSLFSPHLYSSLFLISSVFFFSGLLKKYLLISSVLSFSSSLLFSSLLFLPFFCLVFSLLSRLCSPFLIHFFLLSLLESFLIWSNLSSSCLIYSLLFCLVSFFFILSPHCSSRLLSLFAIFLSSASNLIFYSSSCLLFCPI